MKAEDRNYVDECLRDLGKYKMPIWKRRDQIANHGGTPRQIKELINNLMIKHLQFTLSGQHEWEYIQQLGEGENPFLDLNKIKYVVNSIIGKQRKSGPGFCFPSFGQYLKYVDTELRYDVDSDDYLMTKHSFEEGVISRSIDFNLPNDLVNHILFSNGVRIDVASSLPQSHLFSLYKCGKTKPVYSSNF
jgi:hypothetical protein